MQKKKSIKNAILIFLAVFCVSCGTINARSIDPLYGEFYPATKNDFKGIADANSSEVKFLFSPWLLAPFYIIDIPISLVTDTLFLPIDIVVSLSKHRNENSDSGAPKYCASDGTLIK